MADRDGSGARQGRSHHRQAAPRPDRHRAAALRGRVTRFADLAPERSSCRSASAIERHGPADCSARPRPSMLHDRHAPTRSDAGGFAGAGRPRRARPAEAEAGGILTIDLAAIVANWRTLARACMPAECAAVVKARRLWLRHRAGRGARWRRPAARRSSSPIWPRRAACARPRPTPRSMCSTGCCRGTAPAFADANLRPVIGSLAELAEWDAFRRRQRLARRRRAARRHRHEPARLYRRRGGGSRRASQSERSRHRAGDEPLRLLREARPSAQRPADPALPRDPRRCFAASPARSPIRREFFSARRRITIWCAPASRSTAPTRRRASPTRCGRWSSCKARIVQVRDVDARRDRRLQRDLDGQARRAGSRSSRSATRTASCAPPARPRRRPAAEVDRRTASAAPSPAASRWI